MQPGNRWDIFCTVVDNYGDIGITWRLARQLASEYGLHVRLWVDDLESFRHIQPEIRRELSMQTFQGVAIHHWTVPFPELEPADVVIEALACHLPAVYEHAMARQPVKPVWLNLEYLSAEDWVTGVHGLPSPHPRLPLEKYFFMPGYVLGTGGVLKENWLDETRTAFQADVSARNAFWNELRVPPEIEGELRISLFSYETSTIADLFQTWADGTEKIRCLVPRGKALGDVARFFGQDEIAPRALMTRGALTVQVIPMLDVDSYDRLLWGCDCNFVRGEDSFVRAQWALKPLVWQAYRQEEDAHWPKIEAFLEHYCAAMPLPAAKALRSLWQNWNRDSAAGSAWAAFRSQWPALASRAASWRNALDEVGDLAGNLVKFCHQKSK